MKWIDMEEEVVYDSLEEAQQVFYDETGLEDMIDYILDQSDEYAFNVLYDIFTLVCKPNSNDIIVNSLSEMLLQIEDTMFYERFKQLDEESGVIND